MLLSKWIHYSNLVNQNQRNGIDILVNILSLFLNTLMFKIFIGSCVLSVIDTVIPPGISSNISDTLVIFMVYLFNYMIYILLIHFLKGQQWVINCLYLSSLFTCLLFFV